MTRRPLTLAVGLLLVVASVATAGDPAARGPRQHHGPPPIEHLTAQLELTEAQATAIEALHRAQHAEAQELRTALHSQHEALREAMNDGTTDDAVLHALVDQIAALRLELDHHRLEGQLATRELLTPPQRERLSELGRPDGARHHGAHRGHHRGPPPDCAPPE